MTQDCSLADIAEVIEQHSSPENNEEVAGKEINMETAVETETNNNTNSSQDQTSAASIDPYEQETQPGDMIETNLKVVEDAGTKQSGEEGSTLPGKEDSDSEFSFSGEDREVSNSMDQGVSEDGMETSSPYYENSKAYPRRSSRKRKLLEKKRKERIAKKQKTNEDPMMNVPAVAEDPADLKVKSDLLHNQWKFLVVVHFIEHFREILDIPENITVVVRCFR